MRLRLPDNAKIAITGEITRATQRRDGKETEAVDEATGWPVLSFPLLLTARGQRKEEAKGKIPVSPEEAEGWLSDDYTLERVEIESAEVSTWAFKDDSGAVRSGMTVYGTGISLLD